MAFRLQSEVRVNEVTGLGLVAAGYGKVHAPGRDRSRLPLRGGQHGA